MLVSAPPPAVRGGPCFGLEGDEAAVNAVVAKGADDAITLLQQASKSHLHVDLDAQLDDAILQTANHFQAGAVADMAQSPIRMGAKRTLQNATIGGPVEDCPVGLEFVDAFRGLASMQLGHPPVVDQLAAAHRVLEVDLPIVIRIDVAQGGSDATFGHDRVGLAQQRLAYDGHVRARRRGLDRGAHAGTAGPDHEHVGRQGLVGLAQKITLGSWTTPAINSRMYTSVSATENMLYQAQAPCCGFARLSSMTIRCQMRPARTREKRSMRPPIKYRNEWQVRLYRLSSVTLTSITTEPRPMKKCPWNTNAR